ncbi:cilia- and flagella-associated protein 107-like [Babylonia areolata]|uniref:cilia- and flagella-associated protein 107-like n=1 Tax=Babylonia areolata TaxID=304850 RepID=UPI003FD570BF
MAGAQMDPRKWHMPGWRIEQKFSPGVLIGNWSEDRHTFLKGEYKHNSTNRMDFRNFGSHRPDVIIRRKGELRNQGLPPELVFHHHGNKYASNMVSWYDEDYNGRWKERKVPELRDWNSHHLAWMPEKNDHPVQEPATNFGLLGKLKKDWAEQIADETRGDYLSTYTASYQDLPADRMVQTRYATPKSDSTTLHPVNKTLKDLHLRNTAIMKSPEKLPAEMTNISV